MNRREMINHLLEEMDNIRPIVIAAMPEDMELRSTTRGMISTLERLRQHPGIPDETYIWATQLMGKLIDAEHGALLKPSSDGRIPDPAKAALQKHVEQRQMLLLEAQTAIPAAHEQLDTTTGLIGEKALRKESLVQRARHLDCLLRDHLKNDAALKKELQQLIDAFSPSLLAINELLDQTGEESSELKQAMQLLDQKLPEDINEARKLLQQTSKTILSAGSKLAGATEKLSNTMKEHNQTLSAMTEKLQRAEHDARNDPLTGLANRRCLGEFLRKLGQGEFCFMVLDVDHFKKINDTYGHDVGDEVLHQLATILTQSTRQSDLAARVGGEEFCVICPNTGLTDTQTMAESLRQSIAISPMHTKAGPIEVTISIGVAQHTPGLEHAQTFKMADKALYQAKQSGRNKVVATQMPTDTPAG